MTTPGETPPSRFLGRSHAHLIDGLWHKAAAAPFFDVLNPATGGIIAQAAEGSADDIDLAVQAARRAFDDRRWRGLPAERRSRILWRFGDLIEENAQELIRLDIVDNGMTLDLATWIVTEAAGWLRHYAGLTTRILGKNASGAMSGGEQQFHAYTAMEPVGVAALILPWNAPIGSFVNKVGPALAAGCSCVVKPAEHTPLSALRLAELALEAGLPAGVLNVVTGDGRAGQALVDHAEVDKVSFTGSTAVGKQIVRSAAANLKRVTLELGGKSPCIILSDADLPNAIAWAANGIFKNAGQNCLAGSRLFVQADVFDEVIAGIAEVARTIRLGNGLDPSSEMGPLISLKQRARVLDYIASGRSEGASIVAGGNPVAGEGYFVEPTLFAEVKPQMRIVREEIFGPVLVATRFTDVDAMIAEANNSRYGLGGGVFTTNITLAHRLAAHLQTGNVWINCYGTLHPSMPFGGVKESGWGREMGSEGMDAFLEPKSVIINLPAA
jgi:acyl-CoA reductase-like NAD-dependent aldehyde dehydrogenase